jgi:hypothetical protein
MSAKCQLTPCENCAENLAYSPAAAVFDAQYATVTWAAQRQAYELGEVALGHVCMCVCMHTDICMVVYANKASKTAQRT